MVLADLMLNIRPNHVELPIKLRARSGPEQGRKILIQAQYWLNTYWLILAQSTNVFTTRPKQGKRKERIEKTLLMLHFKSCLTFKGTVAWHFSLYRQVHLRLFKKALDWEKRWCLCINKIEFEWQVSNAYNLSTDYVTRMHRPCFCTATTTLQKCKCISVHLFVFNLFCMI